MKLVVNFIAFILLVSCSNKETSLNQYANYPVKFAKQKIVHPDNDFELMIPKGWKWETENYEDNAIISGINAKSKLHDTGFFDMISVQKVKDHSEHDDLDAELKYALQVMEFNQSDMKVLKSGNSDKILNRKSIYLHVKTNTDLYGESEVISFLLESNQKGVHYELVALVSADSKVTDLKMNMAIIINCLQSFKEIIPE